MRDEATSGLSLLGRPMLDASLAFLTGAILGFVLSESEILESRHNVFLYTNAVEVDQNRDGEIDLWYVYRGPDVTRSRQDRNFDGEPDRWDFFRKGLPTRTELDDNFDGDVDVWISYDTVGGIAESQHDANYDEIPDSTFKYANDVVLSGQHHPDGGRVERIEDYTNGILRAVYRIELDGTRRQLRLYDEYGRELALGQ